MARWSRRAIVRPAGHQPADGDRDRGRLGIPCREADIDLYDAYAADEAFLTSTSLCLCPVRSVNGMQIGGEEVFGPVTAAPDPAYTALVDCDFVDQYRRYLR